jgi:peptidoglycan/xylan/chitin deacetylase (PgdA/CDA1 family)
MKLATLMALFALVPAVCMAEKVAITFDDLPINGSLPAGVTEVDIVKRVLPIFAERKLPPMYGFINARKLESSPAGATALQLWVAAGQRVGNHTYSHIDLTRNSAEDFARDVQQNEPALLLLSSSNDWRWFRYPYLHEGDTYDKRRAIRTLLHDRGYQTAQTTLDFEDYLWNSAYARCSDKRDSKAIAWLRSSYLETAAAYLDANRSMAKTVYGREISHVLLLHLGAFSPEILPSLFDLLEARGFTFVTLPEAQSDPAYQSDPNFVGTNTGTLLEQHLDAKRLPYPAMQPKPREKLAAICM